MCDVEDADYAEYLSFVESARIRARAAASKVREPTTVRGLPADLLPEPVPA